MAHLATHPSSSAMTPNVSPAQERIPLYTSITDVYGSAQSATQHRRWTALVDDFEQKYGRRPAHVIRAPGRVNVLGEHVDYSLFPVLPAAINQDVLVALAPRDGSVIRVANSDPALDDFEINMDGVTTEDTSRWAAYTLNTVRECVARVGVAGMDLLITGNIPQGAGLSSSAAFVVSVVLAFLVGAGKLDGLTKGDIVALALASEHRMGLRNGGLDHSASVMSKVDCLTHLDFIPTLSPTPVPLPTSLSLVVSDSLATHSLTGSSGGQYNMRVTEGLAAATVLARSWGVDGEGKRTLREVLLAAPFYTGDEGAALAHAITTLEPVLGKDAWSRAKVQTELGLPLDADRPLELYKRALYTYEEALRLLEFTRICKELQAAPSPDGIDALGRLLSDTHAGLRDLYEATVPPVDELQAQCLALGAIGSRQTGGGWGGAVISLVRSEETGEFIRRLTEAYAPLTALADEVRGDAIFVTEPSNGASVYRLGERVE